MRGHMVTAIPGIAWTGDGGVNCLSGQLPPGRTGRTGRSRRPATDTAFVPALERMDVPEQPWWRQVYDWAERTIGPPLEAGVKTDTFADVLAATTRLRADLDRRRAEIAGQLNAASARWLHLVNLPAADDVRRLREEILKLDRQLRDLTRRLDQVGWKGEADGRAGQPGGGAGAGSR